jgi:hypothetical protein
MVAVAREALKSGAPVTADAIPLRLRRYGGSPRQVAAACLIGTLLLGMLTSHDLVLWLYRLGDGPLLVPLQQAAAGWDGAMDRLGLTLPEQVTRDFVQRLLDWEWGSRP